MHRRGPKLERINSITLEQKEKEAKEKIINIFSMRCKIKKWKNNTDNLNSKGCNFLALTGAQGDMILDLCVFAYLSASFMFLKGSQGSQSCKSEHERA